MDERAGWVGGPESGSKLPHSKTLRESGSGAGHRGLEGAEFTIRRVEFPRTDKVSDLIGNSELVLGVGEERVVKWWIGYLPILADKKSFWRCGNFPISVSREDFDKLSRAAREGGEGEKRGKGRKGRPCRIVRRASRSFEMLRSVSRWFPICPDDGGVSHGIPKKMDL